MQKHFKHTCHTRMQAYVMFNEPDADSGKCKQTILHHFRQVKFISVHFLAPHLHSVEMQCYSPTFEY